LSTSGARVSMSTARTVVVCAITPDAQGRRYKERQTFGTMTPDLLRLRDWLTGLGVTHVAMEKYRQLLETHL
jgi:hypothetical protein